MLTFANSRMRVTNHPHSATVATSKNTNVTTTIMAKWSITSADSGILRKKPPEKHEELLVFGYACKLFRDDEKALYIDQGKHLIPWMGDGKLKIDRLGFVMSNFFEVLTEFLGQIRRKRCFIGAFIM